MFMKLLIQYYSFMTYKEVELSFELLLTGALDEYLPKNAINQPDRSHYQSFSKEYVTKILNAFKGYKNSLWSKANKLLPKSEAFVDENQKKEFRQSLLLDVTSKYNHYRETKEKPFFRVPFLVMNLFIDAGIVSGYPEIDEERREIAYHKLMTNDFIHSSEKRNVIDLKKSGKLHERLQSAYDRESAILGIIKVFDKLILARLDIEDIIQ